jgi:hypothetical protein
MKNKTSVAALEVRLRNKAVRISDRSSFITSPTRQLPREHKSLSLPNPAFANSNFQNPVMLFPATLEIFI